MTDQTCEHARILVHDPKTHAWTGPNSGPKDSKEALRRKCGCVRTSDKVKAILSSFPSPPPPTPDKHSYDETCVYGSGRDVSCLQQMQESSYSTHRGHKKTSKPWRVVGELVQLVQLSVTATALALYYLIYCYMQLVYYTLRTALYFHNADGPMKITIGVVTLTSLMIGFNLMVRMERILGILY